MKQIVCEMCGSSDLVKKDGVFVCQYCNSKYSVEEAKKLMVTIDTSVKVENALKNARRAMKEGDYEQAEKYYNIAKMEEPENWEVNFYSIFCKVAQEKIPYISPFPLMKSLPNILNDIKKLNDTAKQNEAIKDISETLSGCARAVSDAYKLNSYNIYEDKSKCADNILPFPKLLTFFGKEVVSEFGKNDFTDSINIQCHETALNIVKDLYHGTRFSNYYYFATENVKEYTEELGKLRHLSYSDLQKGPVDTMLEYLPLFAMLCVLFAVLVFILSYLL